MTHIASIPHLMVGLRFWIDLPPVEKLSDWCVVGTHERTIASSTKGLHEVRLAIERLTLENATHNVKLPIGGGQIIENGKSVNMWAVCSNSSVGRQPLGGRDTGLVWLTVAVQAIYVVP